MKGIPFILLLIVQVYLLSTNFYSISADEAGHTIEAVRFYQGASLFSIWLPFEKVFLGFFLLFGDMFWMPRIISMIFGHLCLASLILVASELFDSGMVIILTGIIGAISLIAVFSVLPLTEIYFFTFVLLSVYFLLKKSNWVYLSTILMTTVRFEGWIFAFIIMLILYKKDGLKVFGLMVFPLFWVILGYFETGSLTGFITQVSARKRVWRTEDSILYNFLLLSVHSGLIIGIFYLKKNKRYLWIFITTLIIWQIGTSLSGATATHNVWRTGLIWMIMLIPFTSYMITQLYKNQKILGVGLLILLGYLTISGTLTRTKESYTKIEDLEAGKFIKENSGTYVMPKYGWEFTNLLVTSGRQIDYKDKITDLNYDYIILSTQAKLPIVYQNNKWFIHKLRK